MRYFPKILIFCVLTLFFWQTTQADDDTPALAQITVSVTDRSPEQLQQGMQTAFSQALIQLSNNPQVMTEAAIQSANANVSQWVQSYSYSSQTANATPQSPLQLQVSFDQTALKKLLKNAGQKISAPTATPVVQNTPTVTPADPNQPLTLVYFQADADNLKNLQASAQKITSNLGEKIIFPELDLSDQAIIGSTDVNTLLTTQQLQQFSQRYGVLSILDGQISQQPDQSWRGNFNYLLNDQATAFTVTGTTSDSVISIALNNMQKIMNGTYTPEISDSSNNNNININNTPTSSGITLEVIGVNDIADYAKIMTYLKNIGDVKQATVKDMNPSGIVVQVNLSDSLAQFQQTLSTEGHLKPVDDSAKPTDGAADLYYYWVQS